MTLNSELKPATTNRVLRALALRTGTAGRDAFAAPRPQIDNGDEALYSDKSGTYTKGVKQAGIGVVDPVAYQSFKKALASGDPADFQNIILGGPRTQNGPQGGLAFYLECLDGDQFTSRRRRRWRATPTRRNSSNSTGLRSCGCGVYGLSR